MMSTWTSPPSPSLDVSSPPPSPSAFLVGWHFTPTLPCRLWDAYVAYLWYYQPTSWVGCLASAFRILAVILILPVVLLTLLDVTSYVIARTLGVVDDVKASTSDVDTSVAQDKIGVAVPVVARVAKTTCACHSSSSSTTSSYSSDGATIGIGRTVRASEDDSAETQTTRGGNGSKDDDVHSCVLETAMTSTTTTVHVARSVATRNQGHISGPSPQACYFTGEEDSLRLAGEGVFSPATSMPPSPLAPHMLPSAFADSDDGRVDQAIKGSVLRRRVQSAPEDGQSHA